MSLSVEPSPSPTPQASRFEQALLAGVPVTKHPELVALLHSPDRTVREVALLLIQVDREEAALRAARHQLQSVARG